MNKSGLSPRMLKRRLNKYQLDIISNKCPVNKLRIKFLKYAVIKNMDPFGLGHKEPN